MADSINNEISNPLISIIIPAYNVEKYILKCITSILEQTYTNLEIIVINDGSTDGTRQLIDNIVQIDKRINAIHKKNSGVSAARNSGIEISTGDYLVFVDGDDYIAPDYVEYMLSLINTTGSDFCFSTYCFTKRSEKQCKNEYIEKLTPEEATALLLSPNVIVGCWNKIFKRSLIINNNILFSTKLFYGEGLTFITKVSQITESVGVGNRKVYYYRRNNENSATTKFDINKLYNGEIALNNIKNQFTIDSKKINTMFNLHFSLFCLGGLVRIKSHNLEKEYHKDYKRWKSYIKENVSDFLFSKEVSLYRKVLLIAGYISPWGMVKLDGFRRRKIYENSITD